MILKVFKSNSPISTVLSLGLLILLWVKSFTGEKSTHFLEFGVLYHFNESLSSLPQWVLLTFSILLIVITASVLNQIINQDDFFDKNTFLPFVLYFLLMSALSPFNTFNSIILSNFFLVLFLKWAFKIRRQQDARTIVFNASLLLSFATLFFPLYAPFLLSPFVLLIVFRPFIWREWVLSLLGLCIPAVFYAFLMYFLNFPFESNTYNHSFWSLIDLQFEPEIMHYVYIVIYGALTFIAFYVVNRKVNTSSLRLRKMMRFLEPMKFGEQRMLNLKAVL